VFGWDLRPAEKLQTTDRERLTADAGDLPESYERLFREQALAA
jgi:hypothetical protein